MLFNSLVTYLCFHVFLTWTGVSAHDVQSAIRQFTNKVLIETEESTNSNFVLSPFSIHSAFSMVLLGSDGRTRTQLEEVLGTGSNTTLEGYTELNGNLLDQQNEVEAELKVANKLFSAQGFSAKESYREKLGIGFQSDFEEKDFGGRRSESVREVDARFMTLETNLRILDDVTNKLKVLELPYLAPNKSMLIILPNEGENTDNITHTLQNINLSALLQERSLPTRVFIPRFKMRYQTSLKTPFNNLGATDLFEPSLANLTGMSDEELYVTDGIHQAFIEVNEEGTEAAAATAVIVGLRSARRVRTFVADRPFLFMVYDFTENITLFAGKLVNPSTSNSQAVQGRSGQRQDTTTTSPRQRCRGYLSDFSNALANTEICDKARDDTDWLGRRSRSNTATNGQLCERSQDVVNTFQRNKCKTRWCDKYTDVKKVREEQWTTRCRGEVPSGEDWFFCKSLQNHLHAHDRLEC